MHIVTCKDGCVFGTKAILLSKDRDNEEWLYRCKIADKIVSTDDTIMKVGCASFTVSIPKPEIKPEPAVIVEVPAAEPVVEPEPVQLAVPEPPIVVLEPVKRKRGRPRKVVQDIEQKQVERVD